jgi:hypothetical protein
MSLGPISILTLTQHIQRAMEIAEEAVQSGDKAAFSQEILLRLIAESDMTEEEKALCRAIISTGLIRDIFTLVVDGIKGKININKTKRRIRDCCGRWFSCCKIKPATDDELEPTPEPNPTTPEPAAPTEEREAEAAAAEAPMDEGDAATKPAAAPAAVSATLSTQV